MKAKITASSKVEFLNKTCDYCNVTAGNALTVELVIEDVEDLDAVCADLQGKVRELALDEYCEMKSEVDKLPEDMVYPPDTYPRKKSKKR